MKHGSLPASLTPHCTSEAGRLLKPLTCLGDGERAGAAGGDGPLVLLQSHIVNPDKGLALQQAVACLYALQVLSDLQVQTEPPVRPPDTLWMPCRVFPGVFSEDFLGSAGRPKWRCRGL